jgi:hypothetical protein
MSTISFSLCCAEVFGSLPPSAPPPPPPPPQGYDLSLTARAIEPIHRVLSAVRKIEVGSIFSISLFRNRHIHNTHSHATHKRTGLHCHPHARGPSAGPVRLPRQQAVAQRADRGRHRLAGTQGWRVGVDELMREEREEEERVWRSWQIGAAIGSQGPKVGVLVLS